MASSSDTQSVFRTHFPAVGESRHQNLSKLPPIAPTSKVNVVMSWKNSFQKGGLVKRLVLVKWYFQVQLLWLNSLIAGLGYNWLFVEHGSDRQYIVYFYVKKKLKVHDRIYWVFLA